MRVLGFRVLGFRARGILFHNRLKEPLWNRSLGFFNRFTKESPCRDYGSVNDTDSEIYIYIYIYIR